MKPLFAVSLLLALICACSPNKPTPGRPQQPAAGPKYDVSLPMDELMGHVIDPAAFQYWKGSGTEITARGERDLSPTTQEGWEQLENGAAVLREAGNLLQLPGRAREPVADWNRYAQELTARAIVAKAAAEKHDKAAVFQAGARLYETCTACHEQFVIQPGLKANPPAAIPFPQNARPEAWPAH